MHWWCWPYWLIIVLISVRNLDNLPPCNFFRSPFYIYIYVYTHIPHPLFQGILFEFIIVTIIEIMYLVFTTAVWGDILISLFYKGGNWGTEKLSYLCQVTELVHGSSDIQKEVLRSIACALKHHTLLSVWSVVGNM